MTMVAPAMVNLCLWCINMIEGYGQLQRVKVKAPEHCINFSFLVTGTDINMEQIE